MAKLYQVGSLAHCVPPKGFESFPTPLLTSQASHGASVHRSDPPSIPITYARLGPKPSMGGATGVPDGLSEVFLIIGISPTVPPKSNSARDPGFADYAGLRLH